MANIGFNTITYTYSNGTCVNTDSINIIATSCVGINEGDKLSDISVYPVPVNNHLNIVLPKSSGEITMKIFNLEGRLIMEQTLLAGNNRINMQSIAEGVYSLQLKNSTGIETKKIVVVK